MSPHEDIDDPSSPEYDDDSMPSISELGIEGDPPYRCKICDKEFAIIARLQRHYRTHTGEKPYSCEYCAKTFSVKENLNVHRRIHTKERPYQCNLCNRAFEHSGKLHRHMRTHTGERPHKCEDSSKSNLSKDLKKSSRHIVPPCPPALCSIQPPSPYNVREVETSNPPAHKYGPGGITCGPLTPPGSPNYLENTLASHNNPRQELPQTFPYDKYGYKCYEDRWRYSYPSAGYPPYPSGNGFLPGPPPPLPTSHPVDQSQLAFFTTITGERIACPINQVIRIPGPKYDVEPNILHKEYEENKKIREELEDKLRLEELRNQRETNFCQSVLKVLESCIGMERLHKLGYPKSSIDDVIMKTLNLMDTQPCWEPSLAPMDRIKVNLRLLLECCIPDQELWDKFGWKGKSIEDIVSEFLTNPN
ncbi:Krueppel-like protein 1 [Armadillidium vulgare]|nr:Krueppel-like protein 1 [Armadillidium vulgare]